jgi:hypothetical protein
MEAHGVDSFQSCRTTPTTSGVTDHSGKFLGTVISPICLCGHRSWIDASLFSNVKTGGRPSLSRWESTGAKGLIHHICVLDIRWGFPGIRHIRVRGSCFLIATVSQTKSATVRRRCSTLTQALCGSTFVKVVNRGTAVQGQLKKQNHGWDAYTTTRFPVLSTSNPPISTWCLSWILLTTLYNC